jgi:hypothetical protein
LRGPTGAWQVVAFKPTDSAMLRLASLLFLLAHTVSAQGTGTLAGTVIDEHGDPLPGANVIIENLTTIEGWQIGAATDRDGNYRIIGIPVGAHTVTASYVGFESSTQRVRIDSGFTSARYFGLVEAEWDDCGCECDTWGCDQYTYWLISTDPYTPRVVFGQQIERLPIGR